MIKKLCKLTISVHVREPHISSSDILKPFVWLKYGLNDSKYTDAGKWDPFRDWGAHEIGNSAFSQPEGYENTQNWINQPNAFASEVPAQTGKSRRLIGWGSFLPFIDHWGEK